MPEKAAGLIDVPDAIMMHGGAPKAGPSAPFPSSLPAVESRLRERVLSLLLTLEALREAEPGAAAPKV